MGNQLPVRRDDKRISKLADPNAIHHPPHFLETDLADERSRTLTELRELDSDDCRRQKVIVDAYRRQSDLRSEACAGLWKLNFGLPHAARGELAACCAVEGNLAELRKIENGVFENAILLPLSKVRV